VERPKDEAAGRGGGEVLELRGFINAEIDTGVVEFTVMRDGAVTGLFCTIVGDAVGINDDRCSEPGVTLTWAEFEQISIRATTAGIDTTAGCKR
jgi:hypothetical protein